MRTGKYASQDIIHRTYARISSHVYDIVPLNISQGTALVQRYEWLLFITRRFWAHNSLLYFFHRKLSIEKFDDITLVSIINSSSLYVLGNGYAYNNIFNIYRTYCATSHGIVQYNRKQLNNQQLYRV